MKEMKIDQGEIVEILVEDTLAVTAQILVSPAINEPAIIDKSAAFTDGSAQITLVNEDTDKEPGDYVYQIRLYDEDGEYIVLSGDCETGDCSVASFVICPVIPEGS